MRTRTEDETSEAATVGPPPRAPAHPGHVPGAGLRAVRWWVREPATAGARRIRDRGARPSPGYGASVRSAPTRVAPVATVRRDDPSRDDASVRRSHGIVVRPTTAGTVVTHEGGDFASGATSRPTADDVRIHDGRPTVSEETGPPVEPTVDGQRSGLSFPPSIGQSRPGTQPGRPCPSRHRPEPRRTTHRGRRGMAPASVPGGRRGASRNGSDAGDHG